MKRLHPVSEVEVISEFLKNEFYQENFHHDRDRFERVVMHADLNDERENALRRALLFRRRGHMWRELPANTAWWHVQIEPEDLHKIRVFPRAQWRKVAAESFLLADIAERRGSGTLRLTVWQNLLISDLPEAEIAAVEAGVKALGLDARAGPIRSGLVACTGNTGCKFALTNTKGQALELAEQLEAKVALDQPLNVHLTGCPNSCAQHYVADIGLLGTKVEAGDDMIEGYDVFIGGGAEQGLGRPLFRAVPFPELAPKLERVLCTYLGHRRGSEESFRAFSQRHSIEELTRLLDAAA